MPNTEDLILAKLKRLYPTGRAFKMPRAGWSEALHRSIAGSVAQSWDGAASILDSLLPDTDRFTTTETADHTSDATDWERRLGMITNTSVSGADRKAAIYRKMQAPGRNPAKGNYLYLQQQLQLAGFNVWVHENLFPLYPSGYESVSPVGVYSGPYTGTRQHGDFQHGDAQHGLYFNNIIANSIYQSEDSNFNIGQNFRCTFFIGGQTLGTYASIPAPREIEFRQLVLRLKQVQMVAFIFINYT